MLNRSSIPVIRHLFIQHSIIYWALTIRRATMLDVEDAVVSKLSWPLHKETYHNQTFTQTLMWGWDKCWDDELHSEEINNQGKEPPLRILAPKGILYSSRVSEKSKNIGKYLNYSLYLFRLITGSVALKLRLFAKKGAWILKVNILIMPFQNETV